VPHPAYSPDRAPSDFFLFRIVKTELQNFEIHSRQDLILTISAIFDEISKDTLNSVYISWAKRLKWVIKNNGKYFSKWLKMKTCYLNFTQKKPLSELFDPLICRRAGRQTRSGSWWGKPRRNAADVMDIRSHQNPHRPCSLWTAHVVMPCPCLAAQLHRAASVPERETITVPRLRHEITDLQVYNKHQIRCFWNPKGKMIL
jgi:hypothetical protein